MLNMSIVAGCFAYGKSGGQGEMGQGARRNETSWLCSLPGWSDWKENQAGSTGV